MSQSSSTLEPVMRVFALQRPVAVPNAAEATLLLKHAIRDILFPLDHRSKKIPSWARSIKSGKTEATRSELELYRKQLADQYYTSCGFVYNGDDNTFSARILIDRNIHSLPIKLREIKEHLAFTYNRKIDPNPNTWMPTRILGTLTIHGDFPTTDDLRTTKTSAMSKTYIHRLDIAATTQKHLPSIPEQLHVDRITIRKNQLDATERKYIQALKARAIEFDIVTQIKM